jgi:hypothetical protein
MVMLLIKQVMQLKLALKVISNPKFYSSSPKKSHKPLSLSSHKVDNIKIH